MAKPPAGSSLLFGALADSGRIKQRKNGKFRMVLRGVEEIDWFTDRPDRVAGQWSPKKLVKKWDGLFGGFEPNAQATFEIGSKRKLVTFEMFKPKLRDSNQKLSFKVRGIGEKNKDLLTGLKDKKISDASLFIDDGTTQISSTPKCFPNCQGANLVGVELESDLSGGNFTGANLVKAIAKQGANLTDADLSYANLSGSNLTGADMTGAELLGTDLTMANLTDVTLTGTSFTYANLAYADLSDSKIDATVFIGNTWNNTTCPDGTNSDNNPKCGVFG